MNETFSGAMAGLGGVFGVNDPQTKHGEVQKRELPQTVTFQFPKSVADDYDSNHPQNKKIKRIKEINKDRPMKFRDAFKFLKEKGE